MFRIVAAAIDVVGSTSIIAAATAAAAAAAAVCADSMSRVEIIQIGSTLRPMGDAAWWQRRMRRQRCHHAISIDVVLIVVNHLMVMVDGWWIGKIMSGARQRQRVG